MIMCPDGVNGPKISWRVTYSVLRDRLDCNVAELTARKSDRNYREGPKIIKLKLETSLNLKHLIG